MCIYIYIYIYIYRPPGQASMPLQTELLLVAVILCIIIIISSSSIISSIMNPESDSEYDLFNRLNLKSHIQYDTESYSVCPILNI